MHCIKTHATICCEHVNCLGFFVFQRQCNVDQVFLLNSVKYFIIIWQKYKNADFYGVCVCNNESITLNETRVKRSAYVYSVINTSVFVLTDKRISNSLR